MEELFIETPEGKKPINPKVVKELKLKKGTLSPFTRNRIVDQKGNFPPQTEANEGADNHLKEEGTTSDAENIVLSTSEMIDLAHGEDSSTEH
jgi:hypothetical protein